MKHLTFLLLTTAALSQQITPDGKYALIPIDKIPIIKQDLDTCDSIIRQDKADIIELTDIVNTLSDNWDIDKELLQTALQEKQNALEEAWKIESDYKARLAKPKHKYFSVGPSIQLGYDTSGNVKANAGVSVQFKLFSF